MNFPDVETIVYILFMFLFWNTVPIIAYLIGILRIHFGNGKWNWYVFGVSFTLFIIYSVNFSIYYGGSIVIFLTFLTMILGFFGTKKAIKNRDAKRAETVNVAQPSEHQKTIIQPPKHRETTGNFTFEEIRSFILSIISGVITALVCKWLGL